MMNTRQKKARALAGGGGTGGNWDSCNNGTTPYYTPPQAPGQAPTYPATLAAIVADARRMGVAAAQRGDFDTAAAHLTVFYQLRRILRGAAPEVTT